MMLKSTLKTIVLTQKDELLTLEKGLKRALVDSIDFTVPHAIILSGIRRCGKSTLLRQLMKKSANYFNFEDPRAIEFTIADFEKLDNIFVELGGDSYFFDEIQNVDRWEIFIRNLCDQKKKCLITGSNASLLSKELGTKLTGRHITYELFPFSYKEYLAFTKRKSSAKTFEVYLEQGGFPEYLTYNKIEMLQELFRDIIIRDIAVRLKLKEIKTIQELARYLISNAGKEYSYNKLTKHFALGSVNTVISYIAQLEDSYLLFTVPRFSYSYKKQLINPKKTYCIDSGLARANSATFTQDKGRMLENAVYMHLRRQTKDIFYFKETKECDFIVNKDRAIQVCYELTEENKEREIQGLQEAMNQLKIKKGAIITLNQEELINNDGYVIKIIPVWKWLTHEKNI